MAEHIMVPKVLELTTAGLPDPAHRRHSETGTNGAFNGPGIQLSLQDRLSHLDLSQTSYSEYDTHDVVYTITPWRPSVLEVTIEMGLNTPPVSEAHFSEDVMIDSSLEVPFQDALDQLDANVSSAHDTSSTTSLMNHVNVSPEEQPARPNPDQNHDVLSFLNFWRYHYVNQNIEHPINDEACTPPAAESNGPISQDNIQEEDVCDFQGINWSRFGTRRKTAREFRTWYHEHPQVRPYPMPPTTSALADTEQLFRFRQMNMSHRTFIEHYQLRNLLVSTSHNDIYYVSRSKVLHTNPTSMHASCAMDLSDPLSSSAQSAGFRITALAGVENILIAGGYRGEYALQNLRSEYGTGPVKGHLTHDASAIANHIHTFRSRISGSPQAVFCSNDKHVRVLDCHTNRILDHIPYDDIVNCAATTPNGRLRVLVGDFEGAVIVDADTGRSLEHLEGHNAHGFAAAWADDDIHLATAAQDCHVLIWDARNWREPLADIACEGTYATALQFSPVGGGKRVLLAAEAADVVNIIDADSYDRKQVIDFFGDVAGITMSSDGSEFLVANSDRHYGGLMSFQRMRYEGNFGHEHDEGIRVGIDGRQTKGKEQNDWLPEYELEYHSGVRLSAKARRRRGLGLHDIFV